MNPLEQARQLDRDDALAHFRKQFHHPCNEQGKPMVYLVGNSLGLQPTRTREYVLGELDRWAELAAQAHFTGEFPWMPYHGFLSQPMANLVGALSEEVVMMNSLTANLHLMLATFYRPTPKRHKILIEQHAFPSDRYAVESQIRWHGYDVASSLVVVAPPAGSQLLDEGSIRQTIEELGSSLAVILLPGVQYYTGQSLQISTLVAEAQRTGCVFGLDLAHAAGNVPLDLHNDQVDFAVWCTYKYLNSGPGSVGGCFIHQRHHRRHDIPRLAGWWGHDKQTRFQMPDRFQPIPTAESWQLSNPPILSLAAIRASLDVFRDAGGMAPLRAKSVQLTRFLQELLEQRLAGDVRLITPVQPDRRGCQLSLAIRADMGRRVQSQLEQRGVMTDWREPDVLRVAPVPLYNSFEDVARFVHALQECMNSCD
jgi:kynureninase